MTPVLRYPGSLSRLQKCGLAALLLLFLAAGVLTVYRTAFSERSKGDLLVFLRAAWALRTGQDIYAMTDHNGWHYSYPPLLVILMAPLADPIPHAVDRTGFLPLWVSVAVWYGLSLLALAAGVHMLACKLDHSPSGPMGHSRYGLRWWAVRVLPILVCLPPILHTLVRGQVNLILLFLLCGLAAAILRGQRFRAGIWLSGAICLKVIPAMLLIYPLWRRDGRHLAGCALGLAIGLVAIPLAVLGPNQTVAAYRVWVSDVLMASATQDSGGTRARELTDVTATHSQSFLAVIHNTCYPNRATRPNQAGPATRLAHWLLAGTVVVLTLLAARRLPLAGPGEVLFLAALILVMLLASPVCHSHYFCLALPAVMGLIAVAWPGHSSDGLSRKWHMLFAFYVVANLLIQLPMLERLREFGLGMYASLFLLAATLLQLERIASQKPSGFLQTGLPELPCRPAGVNQTAA